MWLLNTEKRTLEEFFDSNVPPYAILSHTWGPDEASFVEVKDGDPQHFDAEDLRPGLAKVKKICQLASLNSISYAWCDTCCIDKRNSADLSEAINSMYRYYLMAESRWFERGWTLQELIAPKSRVFFANDWSFICMQMSTSQGMTPLFIGPVDAGISMEQSVWQDIAHAAGRVFSDQSGWQEIAQAAGIAEDLLRDRLSLPRYCVAERMSWASRRTTTRSEDMAYSLMGIFGIHMPVLYGEGGNKAFKRLQLAIMETSFDQTLFAWRRRESAFNFTVGRDSGLLAAKPAYFGSSPKLSLWRTRRLVPYLMTNTGLAINLHVVKVTEQSKQGSFLRVPPGEDDGMEASSGEGLVEVEMACLQCDIREEDRWKVLLIYVKPISDLNVVVYGQQRKAYRRIRCDEWKAMPASVLRGKSMIPITVLQDEQVELLELAAQVNQEKWAEEPEEKRPLWWR